MKKNKPANQWMVLFSLGWMLTANLAVFLLGGAFLDKRFGTSPWLLITGAVCAFVACGFTVYHSLQRLTREESGKPPL